jgi:hypothetical protein
MRWIKSPTYFCSISDTGRNVATDYCATPIGSLQPHKFISFSKGHPVFKVLPLTIKGDDTLQFLIEVSVDDFMSLAIAMSKHQLQHITMGTMMGIHDVFPPSTNNETNPISLEKLKQNEG